LAFRSKNPWLSNWKANPLTRTRISGYEKTSRLGRTFTGLFAFNDISAIGAVQALREAGRRVPEDVSVVGFDDIQSAAFQNPALTTVRQPLREMGVIAAEMLLKRITAREYALSKRNRG